MPVNVFSEGSQALKENVAIHHDARLQMRVNDPGDHNHHP
jgi:hypothetical protein